MKHKIKYSIFGLVIILILIQLIPVNRNNPSSAKELEIIAPPEIKIILENSCYDCHSNQTKWPFYSYIAPVSWLVAGDVHEGRDEFNFSEWFNLPVQKRERLKEKMIEEIMENKMPLPAYLMIHSQAGLNELQKKMLKDWAEKKTDAVTDTSIINDD